MRFLVFFNDACNVLSEERLKRLMKVVSLARKRRFKGNSGRVKYGNTMNRGFTEYEIKQFFSVIKNPKHYLLFQYQANLGLRVGEAVKINVKDINSQTRELKIFAPKYYSERDNKIANIQNKYNELIRNVPSQVQLEIDKLKNTFDKNTASVKESEQIIKKLEE